MKKHVSLTAALRLFFFVNVLLCMVATLSVLMTNGAGRFTMDHLCLLVLFGITGVTALLLKTPGLLNQAVVFCVAALPLLLVCHRSVFVSFASFA